MTRTRAHVSGGMALALVTAATTWVAMSSWRGFTERPSEFLSPLLLVAATVAVSGALGRGWRIPGGLVFLGQVLLGSMMVSWLVIGSPFPVGAGWTELVNAFDAAFDSANTYAAPVPHNAEPVFPLLIAGGLGAMLMADLLACTLRRVPVAGLPMLTVYSLPVSLLDGGIGWGVFLFSAIGFLIMLFLQETAHISRWGRSLGPETTDSDLTVFGSSGVMRTSAGKIGGVATALAVVVPVVIPTISLDVFDFGIGDGGDSEIKIENPMTDLRRDLKRGEDFAVIQVSTNDPDPDYLRISVLNRFSDNEWTSGNRDIPDENRPDGALPDPPGLASTVPRELYDYDVDITDSFVSKWLPTQSLTSEITAPGDWRYDESTMDFISSDDDLSTAGIEYSMTAIEAAFDARALAVSSTESDTVDEELVSLPAGIPIQVRNLAFALTDDAPTKFQAAVILQEFFRVDGGFEYDLRNAPEGNGVDDLADFLNENGGRVGYCEQFASAMAVLARIIGIPARVAVGFLHPQQIGADLYEYSTHDLHAWPELYFEGAGWVRFEPTPSDRTGAPPEYTTDPVTVPNETLGPSNSSSASGGSQSVEPTRRPVEPGPTGETAEDGAEESGFPWLPVGGGLAGALLIGVGAVGPRVVRRSRREHRLEGGPEQAWEELWATVTDLRLPWPDARSPRETRHWMAQQFGAPEKADRRERPAHGSRLSPEAVAALDRIVRELELLRYSRIGTDQAGALRDDVLLCTEALKAGVPPRVRRQAQWWPRSLVRRMLPEDPGQEREQARFGGVVEHI